MNGLTFLRIIGSLIVIGIVAAYAYFLFMPKEIVWRTYTIIYQNGSQETIRVSCDLYLNSSGCATTGNDNGNESIRCGVTKIQQP